MSFWQKQDGSQIESTTTFEAGGGDIQPIPNNTALIAAIEEAKWAEYDGEHYINLKWRIMRPADYANRVIFQKLKVFSEKQGDKAKQMLAAIDANAGGKLSKLTETPEDMHLMTALVGKPMAVKVQIWDINGKQVTGLVRLVLPSLKHPYKHKHQNQAHLAHHNAKHPYKLMMTWTAYRFNLTTPQGAAMRLLDKDLFSCTK